MGSTWLYADDLNILSRSKTGLQNCLNALAQYCTSWMLQINPKKTKIMVFQKRAKKYECNFYIDKEKIDTVQNYTYLGTRISSSGNFTLSLDHLREKALHALFALRRHVDLSRLKPSLACKIFDTMISPILTYNSEAWGVFAKSDFKSWDTKCGTFLDGLLGVVLLVVAQPPQPAPFLGVVLQVGAQRPQPASF